MLARALSSFFEAQVSHHLNKRYLLAVSGGMDSMLLLHLMHQQKFDIAVAHCNFQLRGSESDGDALFVEAQCKELGIPFFVKRFDTKEYKASTGESTQLAARHLRYTWFETLRIEQGYDYICTAHHQRDNAETLIYRFMQGAYPESLQGIKPVNGHVLRPMLYMPFKALSAYAIAHQIQFRTDSSNLLQDYSRNKIRHAVLPELEKIFGTGFEQGLEHAAMRYQHYYDFIKQQASNLLQKNRYWHQISIDKLRALNGKTAVLYELIKHYGFNWYQCQDICTNLQRHTGVFFDNDTRTFRIYFSGHFLQIVQIESALPEVLVDWKNANGNYLSVQDFSIHFRYQTDAVIAEYEANAIYLDADLIQETSLLLRPWRQGDSFIPLGLHGHKSVADFLKDKGLSPAEKDYVYVLCDGDQIVGIPGFRVDDSYRLINSTKNVLKITLNFKEE